MTSHHHNNNQQPHHAGGLYARQAGGFDNRRAAGAAELSSSMNRVVGPPGTLPQCSETTAASLKPYDKTTQPKTTMKMPNHAVVSDEEGPFPIIQAEAATPRMLKTWAAHSSNAMAAPRVHFSGTTSQHAVPRSPPTSNKKKKASRVARTSPGRPSKQAVHPRTSKHKVSSIKKKLDAPPTPDAHPVSVVTKKKPAVPSKTPVATRRVSQAPKTPVATTSSPQKRCFSPSSSHKSSSGGKKLRRVDFASLECRTTAYSVAPSTSNSLAGPQRQERPILPTRSSEPRPEPDQCEQTNQDIGWPIVPTRSSEPRPEPDDLYYFPPAPTAKPMSKLQQYQHDIVGNLGPRYMKITAGILHQVVQRGAEKLAAESTAVVVHEETPKQPPHRNEMDVEALVATIATTVTDLAGTVAQTNKTLEISQQLQQRRLDELANVVAALSTKKKPRRSSNGTRAAPRSAKKTLKFGGVQGGASAKKASKKQVRPVTVVPKLSAKGEADKADFIKEHEEQLREVEAGENLIAEWLYKPALTLKGKLCLKCMSNTTGSTPGRCSNQKHQDSLLKTDKFELEPTPGGEL